MRPFVGVLRSLGAVGLLIGLTFSCGNDTSTDPDDDDGSGGTTSNAGGSGGSGGSGGTGGTDGQGGNGTTSTTSSTVSGAGGNSTATTAPGTTSSTTGAAGAGPEPMTGLAEPCDSDDDCQSELICLTADSNSLSQGGPSNGFCTAQCDGDALCGGNAACITFEDDGPGYCMPMCIPNDGTHDCAERPDAVCDILPVNVPCTTNAECPAGTACLDATECVLPVCLPKCRADSDCPEGRFCDPGFGECVDEQPEGKALNEVCDDTAAEDECLGFCSGGDDVEARCLETCVLGVYPACGSESTESGTADCLYPYVGEDVGDLGFCIGLCDCNSDCPDEGLVCVSFESLDFDPPEIRGRAGFCAPPGEDVEEDQILDCAE